MEKREEDERIDRLIKLVSWTPAAIFAFLFVLLAAYMVAFVKNGWAASPDAWGQFGDYIGGLANPLVATFALVALVINMRLQKSELQAALAQLESADAVAKDQARTAEHQRREQRFFDMLRLYQETLRSVEFDRIADPPQSYSGKAAFQFITSNRFPTTATAPTGNPVPDLLSAHGGFEDAMARKYEKALEAWSGLLDHYFRVIFLLLREAEPTLGERHYRYVKYLRAQLSRDELQLLALNMLFDTEGRKMVEWAAQYGILKHLPPGPLRDYVVLKLPARVFGRTFNRKRIEERLKRERAEVGNARGKDAA